MQHKDDKDFNKRGAKKNVAKIRGGGDNREDVVEPSIKKIPKKLTSSDVMFIINSFKNHFVFYNLSENELETIVSRIFYCEIGPNKYIFQQGDAASSYFILEKGSLEISVNGKAIRTLKKGEGFGELALLYNAPRSASVKTLEQCHLWGINRSTFRAAVEEMTTKKYEENRKFVEGNEFFKTMTVSQRDAVAEVLINQKFVKGQTIVHEGDPASSFYIIKSGNVQVSRNGKAVANMGAGDSFGEQALYDDSSRGATIAADGDVECLALGRDTITKILGDQVQTILFRNQTKWAFEKKVLFSKLTKIQIEKILNTMAYKKSSNGQVIYKQGSSGDQKIVVVLHGSLKNAKTGAIVCAKGACFGDESFLPENKPELFSYDIVMGADGVLSEITKEDFLRLVGGNVADAFKKNENSHEKKMMNMTSELRKLAAKINLEELIYYKKLGFGQFGSVYLVRHKSYTPFFALKCVSKAQVVEQSLEKHLQQEMAVLKEVSFPFIMDYIRTYKDQQSIFFLLEYIQGMELFDVIREIGLLSTYDSQFYIGSLILCIEYLHARHIVYRDIKPENIMVDEKGYIKMIDMGTAKYLSSKTSRGRTFTIIGTPHYMAPEILTGKGYGLLVDIYSIGVCLYEFMCGMVPYGEEAEDPYEIYEEALTKPLKYPGYLKDKKARKLMDQMLNKNPEARMGGSSFASLKANPWFDNFDWDHLLDRQLKSPYVIPKEKLISDAEIKKMAAKGCKVTDEIKNEQKANPRAYNPKKASDPNWDKDF